MNTDIADNIKARVARYYIQKRRAIFYELGLLKSGRLRADVFVLAMNGHIVVVEVKSSVADYKRDASKKLSYFDYSNQFYYAMPEKVYLKIKDTLPDGAGTFVMDDTGTRIRKVRKSRNRVLAPEIVHSLALRAAFRNGDFCNRKNKRVQE
jgi:hypothetical protein